MPDNQLKKKSNQPKISDIWISDVEYKTVMFSTLKWIEKKLKNMSKNKRF